MPRAWEVFSKKPRLRKLWEVLGLSGPVGKPPEEHIETLTAGASGMVRVSPWQVFPRTIFFTEIVGLGLGAIPVIENLHWWTITIWIVTATFAILGLVWDWVEQYKKLARHPHLWLSRLLILWQVLTGLTLCAALVLSAYMTFSAYMATRRPTPTTEAPVMIHWPPTIGRGTSGDSRGDVVVDMGLFNTTGGPETAAAYGHVKVASIPRNDTAELNTANALKQYVRTEVLLGGHAYFAVDISPSEHARIKIPATYARIIGQHLSDAEWAAISSGTKYVYFDAVIMVRFGHGIQTSIPDVCGIWNGEAVLACPTSL